QTLTNALRQSGFKSDELTFISFIAVVRYLDRETFISMLTSIVSSMRAGSEVVFDFDPPPSLLKVLRGRALPGRTEVLFAFSSFLSLPRQLQKLTYRMIVNWTFRNNNDFRPTYFDI